MRNRYTVECPHCGAINAEQWEKRKYIPIVDCEMCGKDLGAKAEEINKYFNPKKNENKFSKIDSEILNLLK